MCYANGMLSSIFLSYALLLCFSHPFSSARDTITKGDPIIDDGSEGLVSAGGKFKLGFFSLNATGSSGSYRRYVGIWYHQLTPMTLVWVANRDNPLLANQTGVLAIYRSTLQLVDKNSSKSLWSAEIKVVVTQALNWTVKLKDDGNLVLSDEAESGIVLWQSFQNPTDTFLPGMIMDTTSFNLTSWIGADDPRTGNFTFKLDEDNQYIIKKSATDYWRSGAPNDNFFSSDEMPAAVAYLLSNFSESYLKNDSSTIFQHNGSSYKQIAVLPRSNYRSTRLVMDYTGKLNWLVYKHNYWSPTWLEPRDNCSVFNPCGNSGSSCNSSNSPICQCLQGFKPQYQNKWDFGDFSGGCIRESKLCTTTVTNDTFFSLKVKKVQKPDSETSVANETECMHMCLNDCKCVAYSYVDSENRNRATTRSCFTWASTELSNLEENSGGQDLHARMAMSDLEGNPQESTKPSSVSHSRRKIPLFLIAVAVVVTVIILVCIISIYIRRRKMIKRRDQISRGQLDSERQVKTLIETSEFKEEDGKGIDVPFFDLQSILEATDNFSDANKLGQGGYGPVYKGVFPGGQEIAVKRLSRVSVQGLQEFKNEVVLIAKLQHRNLVRLRGYCLKGEEKILLYEYMPNKSLDSFIFDHTQSVILNWEMRFNIILGIARGLLYLHQDSRLRIVHRDLKTSNVLLDEEMNPKISDFGLARIVGGKETEANTNTVVGTYGYMSPEYALDGTFSIKSDVFSFGVVLLEIISGRKNAGFYQSKQTFSLICYAWELWTEDKVLDLMDKNLQESCDRSEFMKCVNVGLLCVQEDPVDRPTMSNVITLLDSETAVPATPKQPAFFIRRGSSSTASTSTKPETVSEITTLEGR
ncbi:hypothetical protein ACLB2K_067543 [Fragaria x ananassa]